MEQLLQTAPNVPPCDSKIFGSGRILDTVQRSGIFPDSKTFVDMNLKHTAEETIESFDRFMAENEDNPTKDDLKQWVTENFEEPEVESFLVDWDPEDYKEVPAFINKLEEKTLKHIAAEVNLLWNILGRRCSPSLKEDPEKSTLSYLPHGFIIPGGRFREIYYWDTYWIIRGLLHCNMTETAKGIIRNFFYQIDKFGFIPNGTRTYYERRSQPPYLISMVFRYVNHTGDWDLVKEGLELMDQEMKFFEDNRSLTIVYDDDETYRVFRYGADCRGPRPEAYKEDHEIGESFDTEEEREEFYLHLKAGTESGWDFSSRWYIDKLGSHRGTLKDAKTNYIIPVDLNCLMYRNYKILGDFYAHFGNNSKEKEYKKKAFKVQEMVTKVLWDPHEEMWFDYDWLNRKRRKFYYASNLYPLWAMCYPERQKEKVALAAVDYLKRLKVLNHPGGLPCSHQITGEQWDYK